jgi:hypothetical protein
MMDGNALRAFGLVMTLATLLLVWHYFGPALLDPVPTHDHDCRRSVPVADYQRQVCGHTQAPAGARTPAPGGQS